MIVGFLRKSANPPTLAKLLSFTCKNQGIDLVYFTPEGILINKKTIKGKVFVNNSWQSIEAPLPQFIDVSPHLFSYRKYKRELDYLMSNCELSIDRRHIILKDKLQVELNQSDALRSYAIPTKRVSSFEDLLSFIDVYNRIVIKPVRGLKGQNVYVISKTDSASYLIGSQKQEEIFTEIELNKFYQLKINDNSFIMQKFITSQTRQGDPFDCRIHMEKDGEGNWKIAKYFIRIGIGQKVVSNISQGGGISDPERFLQVNYEKKADSILKSLKKLARIVPIGIERITNSNLMNMGIDVGIDGEGHLYIFEINSFPIVAPQMSEISLIRAEYYRYKLDPKFRLRDEKNNFKRELRNIRLENELLIKQNNNYSKAIKAYKSSTSWKITKPLRWIGKIKNKILKRY